MDPDARDPLIDRIVADNYLIEEVLGEGAMGRVYRARQLSLDKVVAVKVLHQHLTGDRNIARRFHREARAASRLNHPNSLHIIDFGQTDDRLLYIVMEHIEGRDLHDILRASFPLPLERIVRLVSQVCLALEEAHAAGIVHRDLKPENIMVIRQRDGGELVKVCDFGIAKIQDPGDSDTSAPITVAGIVCGTPEYMAPEQCRGEPLDGRADLYSAGVILYQLATNALPFVADTPLGVVTRQLTDEPTAPTLIDDGPVATTLEPVILKALSKDRTKRHGSALELKADVERVAAQGVPVRPARTGRRATAPRSRVAAPAPVAAAPNRPEPVKITRRGRGARWPIIIAASLAAGAAAFLAVWLLASGYGSTAGPRPTPSAPAPRLTPRPTAPDAGAAEPSPPPGSSAVAPPSRPSAAPANVPVSRLEGGDRSREPRPRGSHAPPAPRRRGARRRRITTRSRRRSV
jgi:serine/threonine-protein kinase